jgi:hypothetical protein
MGRKLPTINAGLPSVSFQKHFAFSVQDLHVPHISLDGERKAASDFRIFGVWVRILERTAGKNRFLRVIEGNGAELLPVGHEGWFSYDFVERDITLLLVSIHQRFRTIATYVS